MKREIKTMEESSHPHIVKYYESIQSKKHFYIVEELCSGGNIWTLYDEVEDYELEETIVCQIIW